MSNVVRITLLAIVCGAMVSVRRRKLINLLNPGKHGEQYRHGKGPSIPISATNGDSVRTHLSSLVVNDGPSSVEGCGAVASVPPEKKQKVCIQIDPENPMEVHTYLMMLKENNKLDIGSISMAGKLPIKDWMEKNYPQIFTVFPQNSKGIQVDVCYTQICLFLVAVKNLVSLDHTVSPEYVKALAEVVTNLESEGFDCRFIRSELFVVGFFIKQQFDIMLARRNLIAGRASELEKNLQAATTTQHEHVFWNQEINEAEDGGLPVKERKLSEQQNEVRGPRFASIEEEYLETVLKLHRELLANAEAEARRLSQVFHRINLLLTDKSPFPVT